MDKVLAIAEKLSGLSEPITKLIEVVSAGVGKAYEPISILLIASAESKADRIKKVGEIKTKWEMEHEQLKQMGRIGEKLHHRESQKLRNIDSVVANSMTQIKDIHSVSDEMPSLDWINNFFDTVENVNDEDMQLLWSKVLTEEVVYPGSFSRKTIEILKSISKYEAEVFNHYSKYMFYYLGFPEAEGLIPLGSDRSPIGKMALPILMTLVQAGLLMTKDEITTSYHFQENQKDFILAHGKKNILVIRPNSSETKHMTFCNYRITRTAAELLRIIDPEMPIEKLVEIRDSHDNRFDFFYGTQDCIENGEVLDDRLTRI